MNRARRVIVGRSDERNEKMGNGVIIFQSPKTKEIILKEKRRIS